MANEKKSSGSVILQIALAVYFIVTALLMLGMSGVAGASPISAAVYSLFTGTLAQFINIALGVLVFVCGVVLLIKFIWNSGGIGSVLMLITLLIWIAVTRITDFFSAKYGILKNNAPSFSWLLDVAKNMLVIGGLMTVYN
jgi:hypothetical protein